MTTKAQIANLIAQEHRRQKGIKQAIDDANISLLKKPSKSISKTVLQWEIELRHRFIDYGKQIED